MQALQFWRSPMWQKLLRVDSDHAEAEGLAAGTGLLTGDLTWSTVTSAEPCPRCRKPGEAVAVDLLTKMTHRRCPSCAHAWATDEVRVVRDAGRDPSIGS